MAHKSQRNDQIIIPDQCRKTYYRICSQLLVGFREISTSGIDRLSSIIIVVVGIITQMHADSDLDPVRHELMDDDSASSGLDAVPPPVDSPAGHQPVDSPAGHQLLEDADMRYL